MTVLMQLMILVLLRHMQTVSAFRRCGKGSDDEREMRRRTVRISYWMSTTMTMMRTMKMTERPLRMRRWMSK
jgi:hypothetical protein